jgi:hypothetical protein
MIFVLFLLLMAGKDTENEQNSNRGVGGTGNVLRVRCNVSQPYGSSRAADLVNILLWHRKERFDL